jgi:acetate kinase
VVLSQQDFSVFVSQVRNDIGTFQKIVEEMDILHHGFIAGASRAAKQLFETQLAKLEALGIDIEN